MNEFEIANSLERLITKIYERLSEIETVLVYLDARITSIEENND